MRLNLQSDYALRLLMHLATREGERITIGEVAGRFHISQNHLMKVAHHLGRLGFIETTRGRSGGLRLARRAEEISVGDVVRGMEADFAVVDCFEGGSGSCLISSACRLKGVLHDALDAFLGVLDGCTIADLTRRNPQLLELLRGEAA